VLTFVAYFNHLLSTKLQEIDFIHAIRSNSREGYELVYRQYGSILYGSILKEVAAEQPAAELFAATMVEIWRRIDEVAMLNIELLPWIQLRIVRPLLAKYSVEGTLNLKAMDLQPGQLTEK
jgi:hypothetical protein